jgi:DNA-binding PadR family transcriptional regulator
MSTRHAILTILAMQPDSGYGLAYRSDASMRPLWSATHSQIYTALRQLEEEGLVSSRVATSGGQRPSTIYSLTEAGQAELDRWQVQPIQYPPRKDPFRMRLAHMNELPLASVEAMIDKHVEENRKLAEQVQKYADAMREGTEPSFEARHAGLSSSEMKRLRAARVAVYEEIARLAEFEIESAERLRKAARALGESPKASQAGITKPAASRGRAKKSA